ncbi:MAG: autotransporter outer membrane beta-barrel domain-containing protein [Thermoguttaceae bacterium]
MPRFVCFLLVLLFVSIEAFSQERSDNSECPDNSNYSDNTNYSGNSNHSGNSCYSDSFSYSGDFNYSNYQNNSSNSVYLASSQASPVWRTWIRGFGNWTNLHGDVAGLKLNASAYGGTIGFDRILRNDILIGCSLGSSVTDLSRNFQRNSLTLEHIGGTIYGRWTLRRLFFDVEGGGAQMKFDDNKSMQWSIKAETGTWWEQGLGRVEPHLGIRHVSAENIAAMSKRNESTALQVGVRYSWQTKNIYGTTSPRIYGGIIQELGERSLIDVANFSATPAVYAIPGFQNARTRAYLGGGITAMRGKSLSLYIRYTAETNGANSSHTILGGMNWHF